MSIAAQAASVPLALAPAYLGMRAIGVTVHSIDATLALYGEVLPLELRGRMTVPASTFGPELLNDLRGEVEIASFAIPTGILQLFQFPTGQARDAQAPVIGPGYTHICIQSPATDPALLKLLNRECSLVSRCDERGVDLGGYGVRYAYARDLEGRMFEVEILDNPHRSERGWVSHLACTVHDHPMMMAFFTELFGLEPYRTTAAHDRPTLDAVAGIDGIDILGGWFKVANLDLEVWQFRNPATPKPQGRRRLDEIGYSGPAYETADFDAEIARLAGLGVELVGSPIEIAGWRTQYATDPEGNLFSVQSRTTAQLADSALSFVKA